MNAVAPIRSNSVLVRLAQHYGVEESKMMATLSATAFKGNVTTEQMMALCIVAEQHGLNPWLKEIYAFPAQGGGIVPVVGVDGWSRIINTNPQFDGMDFIEGPANASNIPEWIECAIYRKDRSHPIKIKEYFAEVARDQGPWRTHPRRMLRHKAMIQCARLAFGFGGIYDQDEAERIIEAEPVAKIDPRPDTSQVNPELRDKWVDAIKETLAMDAEEHVIATALREINDDLSRLPELFSAVFDKVAKDGICSKAAWRKWLAIEEPKA